jgi:hypothetical protein
MSTQENARYTQALVDLFDRHGVSCGNCSAQIIARGGTLGEHHGVSQSEGEEESLCGYCAGKELLNETTRLQARVDLLECALIELFDIAIPQAQPWKNSPEEKAEYSAKVLPEQLRALLRGNKARVEQLERERRELRDALRDIAVATPAWSENVGNLAGGETWHGFSQRLKQRALAALGSEPTS